MLRSKAVSFFVLAFTGVASASADVPVYYWDNQEGFVEAADCQISPVGEIDFRLVREGLPVTENLKSAEGAGFAYLPSGSLVGLRSSGAASSRGSVEIKVIGLPEAEAVKAVHVAERLDEGSFASGRLDELDKYVMEIGPRGVGHRLPVTGRSALGTLWQTYISQASFQKLECQNFASDRRYPLFAVHDPQAESNPVAYVGVSLQETDVLAALQVMAPAKAVERFADLRARPMIQPPAPEISNDPVSDSASVELPSNVHLTQALASIDTVTCTRDQMLNVRDESLRRVIFKAGNFEKVKIFNGPQYRKPGRVGGGKYIFVKAQFPEREEQDEKIGWVAAHYLMPRADCKYGDGPSPPVPGPPEEPNREDAPSSIIGGLDDPDCCEFPTIKRPTHSYLEGMRRFKAARRGGRWHAASDLYRSLNEPVTAVAAGKVIRGPYKFYQGTYAIDVRHAGGFVVRYGEITSKRANGIQAGVQVKEGQRVGYIGKVNSGCCRPMLHFELYSGEADGPLRANGNRFQRRRDLMNPSEHLRKWERKKFGESH